MAEDDSDVGMSVEQPAEHQPQRVSRRLDAEAPCRTCKAGVVFVTPALALQRHAWMQVYGNAQVADLLPERRIHGVIQIPGGVGTEVGESIHEDAEASQFRTGSLRLGSRGLRILQRNAGKCLQPRRALLHKDVGGMVVHSASLIAGLLGVLDVL